MNKRTMRLYVTDTDGLEYELTCKLEPGSKYEPVDQITGCTAVINALAYHLYGHKLTPEERREDQVRAATLLKGMAP